MNKTESKVKSVLKNEYDRVFKCGRGGLQDGHWYFSDVKMIRIRLSKACGYEELKTLSHFLRKGVPDFIAYNFSFDSVEDMRKSDEMGHITDYSFVEVKKEKDQVRSSQLKWLHDFPNLDSEYWVVAEQSDNVMSRFSLDNIDAKFLADEWLNLLKFEKGDNVNIEVENENRLIVEKVDEVEK